IPATILNASVQTVILSGRTETNVDTLYCQPGLGRKVYEGDSGSPVLINGNIAGGLFGTAGQVHFDARGIQQEMATSSGHAKSNSNSNRINPQWHFEGPADLVPLVKAKPGFGATLYEGPVMSGLSELDAPVNTVPPLPGRRFASPFVIGPNVV